MSPLCRLSLANFELINTTLSSLAYSLSDLGSQVEDIAAQIDKIRQFYELLEVPNQIEDGHLGFPENQMDLSQGISVEFRNVSFVYANSGSSDDPEYVLKNVSFKIEQGQLCVCFSNSCFFVLFC